MRDGNDIVRVLRDRQCQMRREMDRRGLSLKGVSFDSGIPYSTLLSYLPDAKANREPALMPVSAQFMLCGAIPQDILSLLLPDGHVIVKAPVELDHDQIAEAFYDYIHTKERAHHPESEAGREIGPNEDNVLRFKAVQAVGGVAA
jgi:hypothetical protein